MGTVRVQKGVWLMGLSDGRVIIRLVDLTVWWLAMCLDMLPQNGGFNTMDGTLMGISHKKTRFGRWIRQDISRLALT